MSLFYKSPYCPSSTVRVHFLLILLKGSSWWVFLTDFLKKKPVFSLLFPSLESCSFPFSCYRSHFNIHLCYVTERENSKYNNNNVFRFQYYNRLHQNFTYISFINSITKIFIPSNFSLFPSSPKMWSEFDYFTSVVIWH